MKKICFIILFLLASRSGFAQQNNIVLANQFLNDFKAKKFDTLLTYFDASLAGKLSSAMMQNAYNGITAKYGELKTGFAEELKSGSFQIVRIPVLNEPQDVIIQFAFNSANKMMGFNLLPKQNLSSYKEPSYKDVTLYNEDNIVIETGGFKLPGIFTYPKNLSNYPVIILVHGSGPGDKDETMGNTKMFKDLALGLAAKGIATIRYDKRTKIYGAKSVAEGSSITIKDEVIDDVLSAIKLVQTRVGVNTKQVYVLGHSLGGMVAPKIATLNKDIAGIILMAAPARSFGVTILDQFNYLIKDQKELDKQLQVAQEIIHADTIKNQNRYLMGAPASYFTDLNKYNQVAAAKSLKTPTLIMQGERDYQVTLKDLNIWKNELGKNKNVTIKSYEKLNHVFTEGEGKLSSPAEYQSALNVPLYVIDDIVNWILKK